MQDFRRRVVAARKAIFFGTQTSLYVVWEPDGPLKFGVAGDPHLRLKTLQRGNPRPLELLCAFPATQNLEKLIHQTLADHRIHGEWFEPVPRVLAIAEECVHLTEICELLNENRHPNDLYADMWDVEQQFIDNVEFYAHEAVAA